MRLKSVTVRNYRIHRDTKVEFDSGLTLIGGPNESGKSTLIEAMHRALFLKAKTGGLILKGMEARDAAGTPEVEVCFETGGAEFKLHKRFKGAGGTVSLTEIGGAVLQGEQAEEKLEALTGAGVLGGGKNAHEHVSRQWGHLWTWQGTAGTNPTGFANGQQAELVARLQQEGGAMVLQSETDAQAASRFAGKVEAIFNKNGSPKAGSDLGLAASALEQAESAEAQARDTFNRLEQAMTDAEEAEREIARIEELLPGLRKDLTRTQGLLDEAKRLKGKAETRRLLHEKRQNGYDSLKKADDRIATLRGQIHTAEQALGPKEATSASLQAGLEQRRRAATLAEQAWKGALDLAVLRRASRDLALAFVTLFERQNNRAAIKSRHDLVAADRARLTDLQGQLAVLPPIKEKDLKNLRTLAGELNEATTALNAMAAGIEVLAADQWVRAGGTDLAVGASIILTEETEITVGEGVRLRLRPGGGDNLAAARLRKAEAEQALGQRLNKLGVGSVDAAEQAVDARNRLAGEIAKVQTGLQARGADSIDADLRAADLAVLSAQGEVDHRRSLLAGWVAPASQQEAQACHAELQSETAAAEQTESAARSAFDAARQAEAEAETSLQDHLALIENDQQALRGLRTRMEVEQQNHGNDSVRQVTLSRLLCRRNRSDFLLAATRQKLTNLQPELLGQAREMLQDAIDAHSTNQGEKSKKIVAARALLADHGTSDPAADLANAVLAADRARDRHARTQRHAQAIQRLHGLFTEEQKQLAERFNQPLADKITGYLQCLFGADARIKVESDGIEFSGISVIRPTDGGGATNFEMLSGGAKEQVAAAARLAIAEILAEDHGGALPVIFDDAFAYSDPDRVKEVQAMLYRATKRGLQVIVLACNPNDYAGLGAITAALRPPTPQLARKSHSVGPDPEADEPEEESDTLAGSPVQVTQVLRDQFISALQACGGSSGNKALRGQLDWDAQCYDAVRDDLVASGHVKKGQGKGGSVRLT